MHSRQIATDRTVVELGGSEGPLGVAGSAARGQRIGVHVVLSMAVDAQVPRPGQAAVVNMAAIASLLIVSPFKVEVSNIVQSANIRKTLCRMAGFALGTKLPQVYFGLGMASAPSKAIGGTRLEGHAGMAIGAGNGDVLARQLEVTQQVVIEDVFSGFQVALVALFAQAFFVHIVFGMAAFCRTILRCTRELLCWVALFAFRNFVVKTEQRPLGIVRMIKAHCRP